MNEVKRAEGMPSPERQFPPERRQAVLRAIRKEEPIVKKDFDRAGLRHRDDVDRRRRAGREPRRFRPIREQRRQRAERRTAGKAGGRIRHLQRHAGRDRAPSQSATEAPKTTRDELMASLYNRRFNLTLNQAYYDGYKLYYSYTLTSDLQDRLHHRRGMPTGFDDVGERGGGQIRHRPRLYIGRRHPAGDRDVFLRPPLSATSPMNPWAWVTARR